MKLICTVSLLFLAGFTSVAAADNTADSHSGKEIIAKFVEANRYWLTCPSASVHQYSYVLNRTGGTQEFAITDPMKTPRPRLQGVTYYSVLQQLATRPAGATVRGVSETAGRIRLELSFDPELRGAAGNGVENSWNGYFTLGGKEGYVVIDAARLVPIEAGIGKLKETFSDFAEVDAGHFVPLGIEIQSDETHYAWRFRLYEPGLWLFDDSHVGERRVAWVDQVKVNEETPILRQAKAESLARENAESAGMEAARTFLNANRHWLLPSLQARRGLVYEYRQETPYLERVLFDKDGVVMVRLEASKESPDKPTRQTLWLADGRRISGDDSDRFVAVEPAPAEIGSSADRPTPPDRRLQNLAAGLGWDCALTRIAREPDAFWCEVQKAEKPNQYRLVAHARKDVRLFAGTMLAFSSWAYMHDVSFDRSEIICDATTHRPLLERDYASSNELKGEFAFEDWIDNAGGTAPGKIRALIPNQKDGRDQSLEMEARFQFANPGVWLLSRVESHFRGGAGGSTGTVSVVAATDNSFAPIAGLLEKLKTTGQILGAIQSASSVAAQLDARSAGTLPLTVNASWTDEARKSALDRESRQQTVPSIGIHQARLERSANGALQVSFDGISTASWKEFDTEWKIGWRDGSDRLLGTTTTNVVVRAENAPAAFVVNVKAPDAIETSMLSRISVEGAVRRMTGMYHGHGVWMRFANTD